MINIKRWKWVVIFAVITLIAFFVWQEFKLQNDFESKGANDEKIAIISYYTAIAGAFAGFFSLIKEIITVFREKNAS